MGGRVQKYAIASAVHKSTCEYFDGQGFCKVSIGQYNTREVSNCPPKRCNGKSQTPDQINGLITGAQIIP
jgi:hypothetical protein